MDIFVVPDDADLDSGCVAKMLYCSCIVVGGGVRCTLYTQIKLIGDRGIQPCYR